MLSKAAFLNRLRMYAIVAILALPLASFSQKPEIKRQPAPVMGVEGAGWLVRAERIQEEQPDQMLAALKIKPGSVVADVGAGVGYHVWRLSKIVGPTGKVIGEELVQPTAQRHILAAGQIKIGSTFSGRGLS